MADRLQELLQQRALIKEHLAWIEGEISAAAGRPIAMPTPLPQTPDPPPPSRAPEAKAILLAVAPAAPLPKIRDASDAMIAKLAAQEKKPSVPTKKGCWIFFCVTLTVLTTIAWLTLRYFYRE
ncbi:MAG: hypothetical protein ABIZ81_15860 [Opitutaceae bacterium]